MTRPPRPSRLSLFIPCCVLCRCLRWCTGNFRFMEVLYEIYWYNKNTVTVLCCLETLWGRGPRGGVKCLYKVFLQCSVAYKHDTHMDSRSFKGRARPCGLAGRGACPPRHRGQP